MSSLLQVENLSKAFADKTLFEKISFGIHENQRMALIAKNGTGKTTLLNILAGQEDYAEGTISFKRDLRIGFLSQDPQFTPGMTVIDACFQSDNEVVQTILAYEKALLFHQDDQMEAALMQMDFHHAWDYEARVKQTLSKLKINKFEQDVSTLSGGQLKRVALANVLIKEPDLLILDEPTNHLDLEMIEWLEEFLKRSGKALLMVTHDRYFLDRVCSDILELDQGNLYAYKGNYSYYLEKKGERMLQQQAEMARLKNIYNKELEWMRRQPQARATKAKARIDAFHGLEERVHQKTDNSQVKLQMKASGLGTKIFEAQYISKSFDDLKILDNFHYIFGRYEKLGIIGKNATGKSTFLKMLVGEEKPDAGHFDIGETVRFGYFSQSGIHFNEDMRVIDAVREIADEIDLGGGHKLSATAFLQHFLFTPETQYNYVYKLSGGEKRRLYLCMVLMQNPNFLVLDEPTNDLDIVTLNILEDYLQHFKGCVIVVSHDRYFMDKIVDHLLVFEGDAKIKDFPGDYTQYREWKDLKDSETQKEAKVQKQEKQSKPIDKSKKLSYQEKREMEQLETDLSQLETEKATIEEQLSLSDLKMEVITTLSSRLAEIIRLLDEKTMRWLSLSEKE